jgi:hypothetical protein
VTDKFTTKGFADYFILETEGEKRRNQEAKERRERRLAEKTEEKQCQLDANNCD